MLGDLVCFLGVVMNCNELSFTEQLSERRLAVAYSLLGTRVVHKLLCIALYLLGVNRKELSSFLDLPPGSIRTLVRAFKFNGLIALHDRRRKDYLAASPPPQPRPPPSQEETGVLITDEEVQVDMGSNTVLYLPLNNKAQLRVVTLTLLQSRCLSTSQASEILDLSANRVGKLARCLTRDDVPGVLDQRKGQSQDYRFSPEVKGEVIQQYILNLLSGKKTTGQVLAQDLKQRCQLMVSPRMILSHLKKMGLHQVSASLPRILAEAKKNSRPF